MTPPRPADVPLGIYVHVPFCLKKCPYCDFNSHAREGALPESAYLEALRTELRRRAPLAGTRRAGSVFFGGGTPSLFGGGFYAAILEELERFVGLADDCEITLEANPGASEADRFAAFRAAGINRLSVGVQSLDDDSLKRLGRVHSADEARRAVAAAREAGFDNLNLDLMFGLPGQTPEGAVADLAGLLALAPEHIALYQLTIEPNTVFSARPPALPEDDTVADTEIALRDRLAEAGFRHYETSNHALPGRACRHNRNYWEFGDYLGLGAGAHGKLTTGDGILRTRNFAGPEAYMRAAADGDPAVERHQPEAADLPGEFALNVLRLNDGVPTRLFPERTGLPADHLAAPRAEAERLGLLHPDPAHLAPTERGRTFLNDLIGLFLE
ncbi:radical SAM family heme chaperone HemW [Thiohalorhabdus methylotrophus]|uniref:Heme chaperone HemW n=1 Tax=Thiohalorhabdus methylotrophus TaxID=3242694 RepID=A0ABV4TWG2_9GAMM